MGAAEGAMRIAEGAAPMAEAAAHITEVSVHNAVRPIRVALPAVLPLPGTGRGSG